MTSLPLGQAADIIAGQHIMADDYNQSGAGTPYLTGPADFTDHLPLVTKWTAVPKVFCKPSDVLITVKGNGVGKTSLGIEASIGRQLMAIRPHPDVLYRDYLFRFLRSRETRLALLGRGATVPGIGIAALKEYPVPLPPVAEQRRIATILEKADCLHRKRLQTSVLGDELLRSGFVHLVGFKNRQYGSWPTFTVQQLAAPKKGALRTGPFGSDLRHGEFVEDGIAVLGIDNAVNNRFSWGERRYITEEKFEKLSRYRVFPGDVLVTIMATIGRSAVVPDDIPRAITTKHLASITVDGTRIVPEFLSFALHSDPMVSRQIARANKGAIMPGLNLSIIKALEIHLPPLENQQRFALMSQKIQAFGSRALAPASNGEELFNSLVQKAFRGL